VKPPVVNPESVALLAGVIRRLEGAYAVCTTAELALAAQNADHDAEIARSLRAGVSGIIAAELQRIRRAAARLDGKRPRARSVASAPSKAPGP
jgi:hypothetical protein